MHNKNSHSVNLFGIAFLRNGIKYDYPFQESLDSLEGLVQKTYIALGASEDGTEKQIEQRSHLHIIPTVWDDNLREGGLILSQQTNIAIEELRKDCLNLPQAWGLYLQSDEVIHENDYSLILNDLQKAEAEGHDAIAFRYLHFWLSYDQVAINKKWYPHEIRAIKLNSSIQSAGDAQSFSGVKKIYYSDAFIYHYGHVRDEKAYERKKKDFHKLWHKDEEIKNVLEQGEKEDNKHETIRFLGPHPKSMRQRIGNHKSPVCNSVTLVGNREHFPKEFDNKICAKEVTWADSLRPNKSQQVLMRSATLFEKFLHPKLSYSRVPLKMRSKMARPWPKSMLGILRLSEKGIAVES